MDLYESLYVHTGQPATDWGAAFGVNDSLLQALCASPVAADQSPSCPSSNQSSESDVHMGCNGASTLSLENQLQQLLEPGKCTFAPFAGYQAATQQQMPLFSTSGLVAAPGNSSLLNLGAANMLPQQPQHLYHASAAMQHHAAHASSAQHPAAVAALAGPRNSSNTDAARNLTLTPEEQQHLLELLLNPQHQQHQQHWMPQPTGMQHQSFLSPYVRQQPQQQQHSYESSPLVLAHELQQLQQALHLEQEPSCYTYHQQQQEQQTATPQRHHQHHQVTTAQQVLAAADAAAAAHRPASRRQPAKQASSKRPAAKQLQQPKQAAQTRVPASSEDDAHVPAAPKKRGRPPLNPGKYSRGYLAIKAYRQRKKGMVEGMEAEIASMQEQVLQLEAEHAALQLKHQVLQAAITASDEVLSQMAALQLDPPTAVTSITTSITTSSSNTGTGLGASSDDVAAALDSALVAVQASSTHFGDADWAQVLARVEYELQRNATLAQQQAQQRSHTGAIAAAGRYKAYVYGTMQHIAQGLLPPNVQHQQRSNSPVSPATNSSSSGFAAFPLGIVDLLQLAQLQLGLQEPAAAANSSHDFMLNLETGASSEVGREFWAKVAQQVPAPSSHQQEQRLEALWEVYGAALGRLAQDRQQLLTQLLDSASPAGIEGSLKQAAAVEAYASRARAITLSYEWALQGMLTGEQAAKMCMVAWPYLPLVGAVVGNMLARGDAV